MNIEVKYKLTEELFKEDLEQWIKYVSKGRSTVILYASSMIFLGVILFANDTDPVISIAVAGFGVYQIISHILVKKKWLKDRLRSSSLNKEVVLEFGQKGFKQINAPEEFIVEQKISKYIESEKGLFIYFGDQTRIYIPNYSFPRLDDKKKIITWLQEWLNLA